MRPAGPCVKCVFWSDGCELIRTNGIATLLDSGSCLPWSWIEVWISRFLRYHHAEAVDQEEDLRQEIQLFLRGPGFRFPADLMPDAGHLRAFLRSAVLNRASDVLRRDRLAPKVRCGACLYRDVAGRCALPVAAALDGGRVPHAHYGVPVGAGTNPLALHPPCGEFFWRYRPRRLEELSARRTAAPAARDPAGEELSALVILALEELMQRGAAGRRRALVLREFFLANRPATAIADRLGVNERTVRRNVQDGLSALRTILENELGVREEDLV